MTMAGGRQSGRDRGWGVFLLLALLAASGDAQAQTSADKAQAPFDPNQFTWLPAPVYDIGKIDSSRFQKWELAKPIDQIDLGRSLLRLDAIREADNFVPRATNDVSDLSDVVMPSRHSKKNSRSSQRYFGLTFTAPTN